MRYPHPEISELRALVAGLILMMLALAMVVAVAFAPNLGASIGLTLMAVLTAFCAFAVAFRL